MGPLYKNSLKNLYIMRFFIVCVYVTICGNILCLLLCNYTFS